MVVSQILNDAGESLAGLGIILQGVAARDERKSA
jgi:hypothetical protein